MFVGNIDNITGFRQRAAALQCREQELVRRAQWTLIEVVPGMDEV